MHRVSRIVPIVVGVLALAFLVGALGVLIQVTVRNTPEHWLTSAALLATVSGLLLTVQRQLVDRQEATSRFYVEQYQAGFDTAYSILDSITPGDPMTRSKWIAAARVLATARAMLEKVSVQSHRELANMSVPHQSQRFQRFFRLKPWDYYGVAAPANVTYEEALKISAERSTAREGSTASTLRSVPERVIHTVWTAVAYPKEYEDVIGDRFAERDRLFLSEDLRRYLQHREEWASAAGKLYKRKPNESIE